MCWGWEELAEAKGVTGSAREPTGVLRGQLQQQETTHHMTGDTWPRPGGQTDRTGLPLLLARTAQGASAGGD